MEERKRTWRRIGIGGYRIVAGEKKKIAGSSINNVMAYR